MEPYDPNKPWISVNLPSREELIAMAMGLIPGGRALKYYHDNPEGPALETLKLAAEDVVPFYGTYRNDGDISDYAKEAVMLGVPMPYIKHPKTGAPIPNNLKEALGNGSWKTAKSLWKNNKPTARKLYADPNARKTQYNGGNTEGGLSTNARINATADAREAIEVPAGPYRATNTGSDIVNIGQRATNNNTITTRPPKVNSYSGKLGWEGDMYPPGRTLANTEEGIAFALEKLDPAQHEYIRKLNDVINENENKWEFLINKTRPSSHRRSVVPKQDIADIAIAQGRPDIAERVMNDNKPRIAYDLNDPVGRRYSAYLSNMKGELKDNAKWKDYGNRQVEKELREQYSVLPDDIEIRQKFAEIYGVPDLYQSWINDPLIWAKYKYDTQFNRYKRAANNRSYRRSAGWKDPNK